MSWSGAWLGLDATSSNSSRISVIEPLGNDTLQFLPNKGDFSFSPLAI